MGTTKVKICGITTLDDALTAAQLGTDFIGLNFASASKRRIDISQAAAIQAALPASVKTVGIFVEQSATEILEIIQQVGLHAIQLHAKQTTETVAALAGYPIIWAVGLAPDAPPPVLELPSAASYLLYDAKVAGKSGGTGVRLSDTVLTALDQRGLLATGFLAGGLTPENVGALVQRYHPFGVDVAGGVEQSPGIKSHELMAKFIAEARR